MKRILRSALALAALMGLAACGQVKPGHVGIKVNNFGSNAGVQADTLGVGWYFTPFGTHIEEYPVFTNTYTFTASSTEGRATDEAFVFQDKSGLGLSADIAVSYSVDPSRASILFQKYRTDTAGLIAGPMRNAIRDSLVTRAAQLNVDEIYGPRKAELLMNVQHDVQSFFAPFGLRVERLFWAGNVRVPDTVLTQINARIANEQEALAAQAKVATVQAQAQQAAAEAAGKAKALDLEGEAIRRNPEVLRIRAIEKWDGKLPQVTSGAVPFVSLDSGKK
ncbi:MAG: SPFH domain-containing protein [Caulobacteraceae bacterium]|nr:SPFH domain-containing protein [Caulobacteraceae bacterium]